MRNSLSFLMKKGCYSLEKKRQKDTGETGDSWMS
jgi:hypothetical protein